MSRSPRSVLRGCRNTYLYLCRGRFNRPPGVSVELMSKNMQPDVAYAWNFGVEQKISNTASLSVRYVATRGVHLFRRYDLNTPPPGDTPYDSRLPYQYFNGAGEQYATNIGYAAADGSSIYHSLQTELKLNFTRGLVGRVNYTWSKETDDMALWWPLDDRYNRGEGTNQAPDIPQNFIASLVYSLPFGHGQRWLSNASGPVEWVLGGWQVGTITKLQSGSPLIFNAAYDNLGSGITNRANVTCSHVKTIGSTSEWFDTSCFTTPAHLQLGNSGSGKVHGPGFYNSDVSLSKSMPIREQMRLTVQIDAFNVTNTPHYSNPDTNLADSNFGQIGGTNWHSQGTPTGSSFHVLTLQGSPGWASRRPESPRRIAHAQGPRRAERKYSRTKTRWLIGGSFSPEWHRWLL